MPHNCGKIATASPKTPHLYWAIMTSLPCAAVVSFVSKWHSALGQTATSTLRWWAPSKAAKERCWTSLCITTLPAWRWVKLHWCIPNMFAGQRKLFLAQDSNQWPLKQVLYCNWRQHSGGRRKSTTLDTCKTFCVFLYQIHTQKSQNFLFLLKYSI